MAGLSGLSDLFRRIEIVSEKDPPTYARLLEEFAIAPPRFLMVGNSLRSDIAPVLALGGWGVHVPYHTTWAHEAQARVEAGGEVAGIIARSPVGENGFGYDPLFYIPRLARTAAELSAEEKNRISHRGQAVRSFAEKLPVLLKSLST